MQLIKVMEEALNKPPIQYEPHKHTLKAWAMYCLRDRGFKVIYAEKADFAVETRGGEKLYFKVANSAENLDGKSGWIVLDSSTNNVSITAPQQ